LPPSKDGEQLKFTACLLCFSDKVDGSTQTAASDTINANAIPDTNFVTEFNLLLCTHGDDSENRNNAENIISPDSINVRTDDCEICKEVEDIQDVPPQASEQTELICQKSPRNYPVSPQQDNENITATNSCVADHYETTGSVAVACDCVLDDRNPSVNHDDSAHSDLNTGSLSSCADLNLNTGSTDTGLVLCFSLLIGLTW